MSILSCFLTVVLSTLSQITSVLKRACARVCVCVWVWETDMGHYTGLSDSKICNKRCCFLNKCGFIPRNSCPFLKKNCLTVVNKHAVFSLIYINHRSVSFTAWPAVSCPGFQWCCLRGYQVEEEPAKAKKQKQNVSKEAMSYISRLKMSANDRNYLIFVDDAHFCHVYIYVMLVWHDYLNFLHLWRQTEHLFIELSWAEFLYLS